MNWEKIFDALGLEWCGVCEIGTAVHHHGSLRGTTIHWANRRFTRHGAHKALRAIVEGAHPDFYALPTWRCIYLINREILGLAKRAHVRPPKTVFDLDRARLRYALSEYTQADRRRMTPSEQTDFRAALRWAARS